MSGIYEREFAPIRLDVEATMPTIDDERVRFFPEQRFRAAIDRLFRKVEARLRDLVPGADIRHVGSTAIPEFVERVLEGRHGER